MTSTEIANTETKLPTLSSDDPYLQAAARVASATSFLKFVKGKFFYGQDKIELPLGAELVPNMEEARIGWRKWWSGEVVDERMELFSKGSYPFREDLGDMDQALWEVDDLTGKAKNPWQETATFPVKSPATGLEFTFTTQSDGGRKAVAKLIYAWRHGVTQGKAGLPVIETGAGGYDHKVKSVGWVDYPTFKIARWVDEADLIAGATNADDDLDDEIPGFD